MRGGSAYRIIRVLASLASLSTAGGCLYVSVPMDIHAGPGWQMCILDAQTDQPLREATILVECYRVEGPMDVAPVVVLERLDCLRPDAEGCYRLQRRVSWRWMWVVWMPRVRHSPVRKVVSVKIAAPGYETVWFPVEGPLQGLRIEEGERGRVLRLRRLTTGAEQEAAIELIARHGWPPGATPKTADVLVPPEFRPVLAEVLVPSYERLLTDFPKYEHAGRVAEALKRWRKKVSGTFFEKST